MIYAIMGPTASGKSALGLDLARRVNGEIISADSMQCYANIEIGTAQPTLAEQQEIPHHLVGFAPFSQKIDVVNYIKLAETAIADIQSRGKTPIIVGGTGFYLKSLFYGLDELPGDPKLRSELDAKYDHDEAMDSLVQLMEEIDPASASKWFNCRRKLIRALEVKLITGRSLMELQSGAKPLKIKELKAYSLIWEPEILRERIALRTGEMLQNGWIEEAQKAIANGIFEGPTSHQALGCRVIARYLNGEISYQEMSERIVIETSQLARRQRTWFRHQHPEAVQIPMQSTSIINVSQLIK